MKLRCLIATLSLCTLLSHAVTYTNVSSADAFVRATAPTLNYGAAGSMSVSGATATNGNGVVNGASDSFMRFNTAAMVANFDSVLGTTNWHITSATLRLNEQGAPPNMLFNRGVGGFEIRWISSDLRDVWVEGTGTPMMPQATGIRYIDESTFLDTNTDVVIGTYTNTGLDTNLDMVLGLPDGLVSDLKAGGEVGFFLTALEPAIGFTFYSRTFMTVATRPFLEVTASVSTIQPKISGIEISGSNVVLNAVDVVAGAKYTVLATASLTLPVAQWTAIATNLPGENGDFTITVTNAMNAGAQQFFLLQVQ